MLFEYEYEFDLNNYLQRTTNTMMLVYYVYYIIIIIFIFLSFPISSFSLSNNPA